MDELISVPLGGWPQPLLYPGPLSQPILLLGVAQPRPPHASPLCPQERRLPALAVRLWGAGTGQLLGFPQLRPAGSLLGEGNLILGLSPGTGARPKFRGGACFPGQLGTPADLCSSGLGV